MDNFFVDANIIITLIKSRFYKRHLYKLFRMNIQLTVLLVFIDHSYILRIHVEDSDLRWNGDKTKLDLILVLGECGLNTPEKY